MSGLRLILCAALLASGGLAQQSGATSAVTNLTEIKRLYVSDLIGANADELRALIIASLDSTKLFVLTDNPDRADAVLKGAADDKVFTDSIDIQEGISTRQNLGKSSSGASSYSKGGAYGGISISDNQSHHSKERKHEAYASVRLCNRDGDVLWSTTQESLGAKFRGASADVASKIARQLTVDMERQQRPSAEETTKR